MERYYLAAGIVIGFIAGYATQDVHWQSFFSRLLASPDVTRIDIRQDGSAPGYEVALHYGKKKLQIIRVVRPTVRDGLAKHLYDDRSKR